jgi:hypothetical protein
MATFGTFTSGQVLTAAELNTAGAWQAYTPTWTQSVAITKTVNWARYTQLGKWVHVSIKMTATGAGTANNKILVGLPVNASADNYLMGTAYFYRVPVFNMGHPLFVTYDSASTVAFYTTDGQETAPNTGQMGLSTSSVDFTVASTDIIWLQFAYEAA